MVIFLSLWTVIMGANEHASSDLRAELDKFAEVEMSVDLTHLKPWERQVLKKLSEVAVVLDRIYLSQVAESNPKTREQIAASENKQREQLLLMFDLHYGPWDSLNGDAIFYGDQPKPLGAGVYPVDMTKLEFETWINAHPEDKASFESLYTVIRRDQDKLVAIPYNVYYRGDLEKAAGLLAEASHLSQNASLKKFLALRAKAFLSDDYQESEMAWMDLDSSIEVAVGPYETYTDQLFGQKAFFEIFLTVRHPEESAKLDKYKKFLPEFEKNLPIADEHKNFKRGSESPLAVVDQVCGGGDNRPGVQTIAFNLPNDEVVREKKGSKKVMLRNVMRAKFDKILQPMAELILPEDRRSMVNFRDFFDEVLFHELAHGLGPGSIRIDGRETTVAAELKETYSKLEEGKADVMGVYNLLFLMNREKAAPEQKSELLATYFVGLFRSMRFGVHEAHGAGAAFQFNYLQERGGFTRDGQSGLFILNEAALVKAIDELVHEVCMIQAEGDYQAAVQFLNKYASMPKDVAEITKRMTSIPVDIRPQYPQL